MLNRDDHARAEHSAQIDLQQLSGAAIRDCPVCGLRTLVQYNDFEEDTDSDGAPIRGRFFPYRHRCVACTFEIDQDLDNPRAYGLQIPDVWESPGDV